MAKFPSFLEYLNDKGSVVEKPEVEIVPDYNGPDPKTPSDSKVPYKTPIANEKPEEAEKGLGDLGNKELKYEPKTKLEYVNEKGKVVEKAKTDVVADYEGPDPKSPEGKNNKPYKATDVKKASEKELEKGLAHTGDKEMVYEPNTKTAKKVTKTEQFLNKTKEMSLAEFTKYMLDECGCGQVNDDSVPFVTAYTTGKFQPHPPEAIKYVTVLANKNDSILENLVSQIIETGYLRKLLKVVFDHPEAYEELTSLFNDEEGGSSRCKSFVNSLGNSYTKFLSAQDSLYESVSAPIGFDDQETDDMEIGSEEDDEDMDSESDDEMGPEEDDDMGFEDDETDSEADDEDMSDELNDDDEDMEDEEIDDEEMDDEEDPDSESDESSEENISQMPERKLKKKFAHDHLLDAMKSYEFMRKAMNGMK